MATAQVTLKTSLQEAQITAEALRMYCHAWKNWNPVTKHDNALSGFVHNLDIIDGESRKAVLISAKLIQDLGLK